MKFFNVLFSGVKWTATYSIILSVLGILKISVLTRYLDKSDFGYFALVTSILSFVKLFSDFGISVAILHKQKTTENAYSSLYWLGIGTSVLIYSIFYGAIPMITQYFAEPILHALLPVAGLTILINSIGYQYRILVLKSLNYKKLAIIYIVEGMSSFVISVCLALLGYGVWALIYGSLISKLLLELLSFRYGYQYNRIRFHFAFKEVRPFINISKYSFAGQLINYFTREIDILLIAKLGGSPTILGLYSLSKQLVMKIGGMVNNVISEVSSPILPRLQEHTDRLRAAFLKIVQSISTFNSLMYGIFILFTPQFINILYGPAYSSIIPVSRILAIFVYIRMLIRFNENLIITTGKTKLSLLMNAITFPLMGLAVWIGFQWQLEGIAWAQVIVMATLLVISWYFIIYGLIRIKFGAYLKALLPSIHLFKEIATQLHKMYEKKNI